VGSRISRQVSRGTNVPVRIFLIPFFNLRGLCDSLIDAPPVLSHSVSERGPHQSQPNPPKDGSASG